MAESDYEKREFVKLKTVIAAARGNFPGDGRVRICTVGNDPICSLTVEAYVLEKFLKENP